MVKEIIKKAEERMKKAHQATLNEFANIRTGRASTALLEKIQVDYYGTPTPLNQIASLSVPEPQLVVIQSWDVNAVAEIEKAILASDLGLTPSNDGNIIRIPFPPLTEERRIELVKLSKKIAEEGRVSVRNIRRDANEEAKNKEKEHDISEDDMYRTEKEVQNLTDKYIEEIDKALEQKEEEIMEI